MLNRALELDPQNGSAHLHLGMLYMQTNDRVSAYDHLAPGARPGEQGSGDDFEAVFSVNVHCERSRAKSSTQRSDLSANGDCFRQASASTALDALAPLMRGWILIKSPHEILLSSFLLLFLLLSSCASLPIPAVATANPGDILYQEEFEDNTTGWARISNDNGIMDYDGGGYRILVRQPKLNIWSTSGKEFQRCARRSGCDQAQRSRRKPHGIDLPLPGWELLFLHDQQ